MTRNEKILGGVWALVMVLGVMFATWFPATGDEVMDYDQAIAECEWIAAADNIECLVIPDGEGWQASAE